MFANLSVFKPKRSLKWANLGSAVNMGLNRWVLILGLFPLVGQILFNAKKKFIKKELVVWS